MKKLLNVVLVALCIFCIENVSAKEQEVYYTNDNGVVLTKAEYDFLTKMYWDGFQKTMSKEEYDFYKEGNYFDGEVESKIVYDTPLARGEFHSTQNKSIRISKSCNTTCAISITAHWINNPVVRSYDVIGAYLYNTSKVGSIGTQAISNSGSNQASISNIQANGFGSSVLLPSGSGVNVYQTFSVTKVTDARVYASYQHATKSTTLAISQKYNISITGYGSVFGFYGEAVDIYDNMNGVDIVL